MEAQGAKQVVFVFLRNGQGQYGLVKDDSAEWKTLGMYIPPHKSVRPIDMLAVYPAYRAVWEAGAYVEMEENPRITMPIPAAGGRGEREFVYYFGEFQAKRGQGEKELVWFGPEQIKMWAHNDVAGWVPEVMRLAGLTA